MKPTRAAACILFVALFVGLAVLFSVLQRPAPTGPNAPIAGKVRVLAQKVAEDKNTIHWRWTIIGDRKWATVSTQVVPSEALTVLQTEPSSLPRFVGPASSSVIHYELIVQKGVVTAPGQTSYSSDITLLGDNGSPSVSSSSTTSTSYSSLSDLVTILTPKDIVIPLPARVSFAKVAGKTLTLRFTR